MTALLPKGQPSLDKESSQCCTEKVKHRRSSPSHPPKCRRVLQVVSSSSGNEEPPPSPSSVSLSWERLSPSITWSAAPAELPTPGSSLAGLSRGPSHLSPPNPPSSMVSLLPEAMLSPRIVLFHWVLSGFQCRFPGMSTRKMASDGHVFVSL